MSKWSRLPTRANDETTSHASGAPQEEVEGNVAGERGPTAVSRAPSVQSRVTHALAVGLLVLMGFGFLTWYYAQMLSRQSRTQQEARSASRAKAAGEMPLPALGSIDLSAWLGRESTPPAQAAEQAPMPEINTYPYPVMPVKTPGALAAERRLSGPVFTKAHGDNGSSAGMTPPQGMSLGTHDELSATWIGEPDFPSPNQQAGAAQAANASAVETLLRPSATPAARAQVLPTQRLLLAKGSFLDCTLETAIDSTLPGMTTCVTAADTFSADGTTVLIERGTKLVGETRGEVRQGASRVFVAWTEARTPTGVVIPLDSPGTDELGRSGLPGRVNRHFWDRFGAAILISIIDGAVQASSRRGTVIYDPSTSQEVMTEVLRGTINIPPTVIKPQGDRIQVLVARDLDFRPVYELHPTNMPRG